MKKKQIAENEIDKIVIAQADNDIAWTQYEYLKKRAERGNREKFLKALSKVPKIEPDENDRIE